MAQYAAPQNGDPSAPDILEFSYGAGQDCRVVASIDGCFFFMEMGSFAGACWGCMRTGGGRARLRRVSLVGGAPSADEREEASGAGCVGAVGLSVSAEEVGLFDSADLNLDCCGESCEGGCGGE